LEVVTDTCIECNLAFQFFPSLLSELPYRTAFASNVDFTEDHVKNT
jgi:hypothetical protein